MRRASAQIFSIGSHRKKHFSFGFRCGILSLVCRCFLKNSILYTEKLKIRIKYSFFHCRSPHGERGLKSHRAGHFVAAQRSLPTRGAWIEMQLHCIRQCTNMSLPTRGAWIEITLKLAYLMITSSLPTRGAWIEIYFIVAKYLPRPCRSPHGERGLKSQNCFGVILPAKLSLPTRGAWIEILQHFFSFLLRPSLPTRGAWIEIFSFASSHNFQSRRSPHGERGLK